MASRNCKTSPVARASLWQSCPPMAAKMRGWTRCPRCPYPPCAGCRRSAMQAGRGRRTAPCDSVSFSRAVMLGPRWGRKPSQAAAWTASELTRTQPAAIINATAFSAKGSDGSASPLDAAGCPVFQVALSTARRRDWAASDRAFPPADLAMHVVLPEVDGRIFGGVVSFKSPAKRDPDLQYSRYAHRPDAAE